MVQYQQYVWYSTNSMYGTVLNVCMVQYQQYVRYSTNSMYGTVPTVCMVQYQQWCDTDVKYKNEPSKTSVRQNAPVESWGAGMK